MILVDTDVAVDLIRQHPPAVTWFASLVTQPIWISGFTAFELFAWCRNAAEQRMLKQTLASYRTIWLSNSGCDAALVTYQQVHLANAISVTDMLIARTALELGLALHTFNLKHFNAVPGLQTIQPYIK
jgi:predicted nucleic acid-binding protein